ncbi:hypothetical protein [Nocardia pneumoniae]|uniref:hypothetical protein n=1 Tax=Nocardia pneumoniae TaxID=228601 RepID=UPI0012F66104|nr:hypothetical protein [Nocardia pneumoniae]
MLAVAHGKRLSIGDSRQWFGGCGRGDARPMTFCGVEGSVDCPTSGAVSAVAFAVVDQLLAGLGHRQWTVWRVVGEPVSDGGDGQLAAAL